MTVYSHSRISTFDQCKYKYKLQYIDKLRVDVPTTIEAFMGDIVHQALEYLYKMVRAGKVPSLDGVSMFYNMLWDKDYSSNILIVKENLTSEDYKKKGESFLKIYYEKHHPFDGNDIVGIETKEKMDLPDGNQWYVRIDKLEKDSGGNYYICDYKTGGRRQGQEEADKDMQLSMYSLWVRDKFDTKKVVLKWHMLAFGEDVESTRTDDQLDKLQGEILEKIREIESTKEFPTHVTGLCNYCVYKSICPAFN